MGAFSSVCWHASQRCVWLADHATGSSPCAPCRLAFNLVCKRQDCQECGTTVCYECRLLSSSTPRVCDNCANQLQEEAEEASSGSEVAEQDDLRQALNESGGEDEEDALMASPPTAFMGSHTRFRSTGAGTSTDSAFSGISAASSSQSRTPPSPASTTVHRRSPSPSASSYRMSTSRRSISGSEVFQLGTPSQITRNDEGETVAAAAASDAPVVSSASAVEAEAAKVSAPAPPVETLAPYSLFNRLGGFGSLLVLDVRSADEYRLSHVPRSLSLPLGDADTTDSYEASNVSELLTALEKRLHMTDQRTFRMRQRCTVVIVARGGDGADANSEGTTASFFSADPVMSLAHAPAALHLARLLQVENKVANVCVLGPGGFAAFQTAYPFVCCTYSPAECASGKHMHRKPFPWYPCEIERHIFLGSKVDCSNKEHLQHLGIDAVLNCTRDIPHTFELDETDDGEPLFEYKRIELNDEVNVQIDESFEEAFAFLDTVRARNGRVLVHCAEGISRSSTIVIGYLMRSFGLSLATAYTHTKNARKQVFPNLGFWKQLGRFEQRLFNEAGRSGEFQETLSQCIDVALLTAEYEARQAANKLALEQAGQPEAVVEQRSPATSSSAGGAARNTWRLQGVAGADAKQRAEEAVVEEAQTPCGPIVTAE